MVVGHGRVLSIKKTFLGGGGGGSMGSEREDFAKSARRDVIDPFHMKMHF